ncbi:MAG: hypothetical protein AB7C95_00875 [Synergistaceae bacterium]
MELDFGTAEVPQEVQESLNGQVDKLVSAAIEKEVGGLKGKNNELLEKLTKQGETLKQFEGIDPVKTRELLEKMDKDADLQMLKDGKLDELVSKKADGIKAKYEDQLKGVNSTLEQVSSERDLFKSKYESHVVSDVVGKLALESKVVPTALDDINRRAREVFVVNEKGELEARDKDGNLLKNEEGDLVTPQRFIEALKKAAPHYWPASKGGGLGGDGADNAGTDMEARMAAAAKSGDMETYNRLRRERQKAKG